MFLTCALFRVLAGLPLVDGPVGVVQDGAPGPAVLVVGRGARPVDHVAVLEREHARPAVAGLATVQLTMVAYFIDTLLQSLRK